MHHDLGDAKIVSLSLLIISDASDGTLPRITVLLGSPSRDCRTSIRLDKSCTSSSSVVKCFEAWNGSGCRLGPMNDFPRSAPDAVVRTGNVSIISILKI
jgi:hypothetical protein